MGKTENLCRYQVQLVEIVVYSGHSVTDNNSIIDKG